MKIVTTVFLPTFSAITTILLIPSCGIHNIEMAKKPKVKLFHTKYGVPCLPLSSCKPIWKNPHSSSEDIREMGSIPFSVMLCFPCSKIQIFLIWLFWSFARIYSLSASLKDNTKVSFQVTLNVNCIKSLSHNPTQRAWDESEGDSVQVWVQGN